jgi:hypothetical protein
VTVQRVTVQRRYCLRSIGVPLAGRAAAMAYQNRLDERAYVVGRIACDKGSAALRAYLAATGLTADVAWRGECALWMVIQNGIFMRDWPSGETGLAALLECGADPNGYATWFGFMGRTMLAACITWGMAETARTLIAAGADPLIHGMNGLNGCALYVAIEHADVELVSIAVPACRAHVRADAGVVVLALETAVSVWHRFDCRGKARSAQQLEFDAVNVLEYLLLNGAPSQAARALPLARRLTCPTQRDRALRLLLAGWSEAAVRRRWRARDGSDRFFGAACV